LKKNANEFFSFIFQGTAVTLTNAPQKRLTLLTFLISVTALPTSLTSLANSFTKLFEKLPTFNSFKSIFLPTNYLSLINAILTTFNFLILASRTKVMYQLNFLKFTKFFYRGSSNFRRKLLLSEWPAKINLLEI